MSIRTRALVFSTFFGSCIAIGLLLVSLTTNNWVRAFPRRLNSTNANGVVNYGLFYGNKEFNTGVGTRNHPVNVYTLIQTEPDSMSFWLWLITALGTGFGLLSAAVGAIASVYKSASAARNHGLMVLLFASNISSASSQILAFICWIFQFYQYLIHNVLTIEDRHVFHWYSHGLAYLGYSFYLLIASTVVVLLNIILLIYAKRNDRRERLRLEPLSEEKNQSAIMLY